MTYYVSSGTLNSTNSTQLTKTMCRSSYQCPFHFHMWNKALRSVACLYIIIHFYSVCIQGVAKNVPRWKLQFLTNVLIFSHFQEIALICHLSSPSFVHPHLPLSKSQIALSGIHHPVFGIIFLLHSVNLVHHLSPPSQHPSLPLSSIPDLKLTCSVPQILPTTAPLLLTRLPTGLQPDCLHVLCTTLRCSFVIFF